MTQAAPPVRRPRERVLRATRVRLPVPSAWQPSVEAAVADLRERLKSPREAIAVTRVEEAEWSATGFAPGIRGLEIWLLARARTYRYRAVPAAGGDASVTAYDP
jgi:hypothetical protein